MPDTDPPQSPVLEPADLSAESPRWQRIAFSIAWLATMGVLLLSLPGVLSLTHFPYALPFGVVVGLGVALAQTSSVSSNSQFVCSGLLIAGFLLLAGGIGYAFWEPVWLVRPILALAVGLALVGIILHWEIGRWKRIAAAGALSVLVAAAAAIFSASRAMTSAVLGSGFLFTMDMHGSSQWYERDGARLAIVEGFSVVRTPELILFQTDGTKVSSTLPPGAWRIVESRSPTVLTLIHGTSDIADLGFEVHLYDLETQDLSLLSREVSGNVLFSRPPLHGGTWSPQRQHFLTSNWPGGGSKQYYVVNDIDSGTTSSLPDGVSRSLWLDEKTIAFSRREEKSINGRLMEVEVFRFYDCVTGRVSTGEESPELMEVLNARIGEYEISRGVDDWKSAWYNRRTNEVRPVPYAEDIPVADIYAHWPRDLVVYPIETEEGVEIIAANPAGIVARLPWDLGLSELAFVVSPDRTRTLIKVETASSLRGRGQSLLYLWNFETGDLQRLMAKSSLHYIDLSSYTVARTWSPESDFIAIMSVRFQTETLHFLPVK